MIFFSLYLVNRSLPAEYMVNKQGYLFILSIYPVTDTNKIYESKFMKNTAEKIKQAVQNAYDNYKDLDENITMINLSDDKWSLREIIGHLIDSASNNHQRFVRLQENNVLDYPIYHYNWIKIEKINDLPFKILLDFWKNYNELLSHIIKNADEKKLHNTWKLPDRELTLEFIIVDYLRHLNEHLDHFAERLAEIRQK